MRSIRSLAVLALLPAACSNPPPSAPQATVVGEVPASMPGADRDAHDCIGSAGYRWCAASGRCERPWELAKAQGFANTAAAFDAYCGKPASAGD